MFKKKIYRGWYIVTAIFFANWMGAGIGVPIYGLFYVPIRSSLSLTNLMLSLPPVIRNLTTHFMGPIVGPLVDKFGPRYLMTMGAIIAGFSTFLMSTADNFWEIILYFSIIGASGHACLSHIVTNTTLARWFIKKRGRATGIATTGINVGEAIMAPLIQLLITYVGWRKTWQFMALVPWLIIAPTSFLFMRRSPEDLGLKPDGESTEIENKQNASDSHQDIEEIWTPKDAFRTTSLWALVFSTNLAAIAVIGVVLHQIPFMIDQGLSPGIAALSLTTYAIFAIPSKLVWGFLAEKVAIKYLTAASLIGSAIGLLILIQASTIKGVLLFGVIYGLTRGAWAVVQSLIWADYFGRAFLGSIRGFVSPIQGLSAIFGPLFAGWLRDVTNSYQIPFYTFVGLYIISAFIILIIPKPILKK
ncbi:MAG: MFS transporter [Dehalococcoidia bacterium]|jgi:sugar phosphate permease|nr:MFS transporter [Dehalococcoidia bacterium]|tara:strand:+ start:1939 stop:3186 length:1248 start_codon:yes stop_codon:yes gene_type:complete